MKQFGPPHCCSYEVKCHDYNDWGMTEAKLSTEVIESKPSCAQLQRYPLHALELGPTTTLVASSPTIRLFLPIVDLI